MWFFNFLWKYCVSPNQDQPVEDKATTPLLCLLLTRMSMRNNFHTNRRWSYMKCIFQCEVSKPFIHFQNKTLRAIIYRRILEGEGVCFGGSWSHVEFRKFNRPGMNYTTLLHYGPRILRGQQWRQARTLSLRKQIAHLNLVPGHCGPLYNAMIILIFIWVHNCMRGITITFFIRILHTPLFSFFLQDLVKPMETLERLRYRAGRSSEEFQEQRINCL